MPPTLCCLCISTCNTFKCLYNDDGELNEVYHMAIKYFDTTFLRPGKYSVICTECCQHITDFHTFQQTVINTQSQLEYIEPIVQLTKLEHQLIVDKNGSEETSLMPQIYKILPKETRASFNYDSVRLKNDAFIAKCKGMLECVVCHEIFETYSLLGNHFRRKHPENECYIYCCKLKFNKRQKLVKHIHQYHNRTEKHGAYEFELSIESFSQNPFLNRHYRHVHKHTDRHSYKCDICGRPFAQAFSLKKHIILKHKENAAPQWFCQLCNRKFKFQSNLEKHKEQIHSNAVAQIPMIKIEPSEEGTNSMVSNHIDKIVDFILVEPLENEISAKVELKTFTTNEQKSKEEQFGDEIHVKRFEDTLGNDNQITDITEPDQFLLSYVYPQNEIQMPPLDIVDIKEELSLEHDNDSNNETSEHNNASLNIKIRNSKLHRQKKEIEYDAFIAKHIGDLECPLCKELHENYSLLRQHFRDEHTGENCYITCCQLKLNSRFRLFEHLQFHIDPKAYQCDVCGKCFKNSASVVLHKQIVHIDKQSSNHYYLCRCKTSKELYAKYENETTTPTKEEGRENVSRDFVNQKYYSLVCCQLKRRMLRNDATIAKWNSELFCRLCGAKFSWYSLLRDHFCSNHPQENFYINCCQLNFYKIVHFLEHIRIHLPPNNFKCEICNIYFLGKYSLVNHMSTAHKDLPSIASTSTETKLNSQPTTGSDDTTLDRIPTKSTGMEEDIIGKQNECNDISMELSENNSNTEKYRRFDAYIAKWKGHLDCVICKTKFANYSLLKRHFSNNHLDQEVHIVCCNRRITKRFKIVEHIRKYHNHVKNLHKCKMCSASFPHYIKLRRHYFQVHNPRDKYEFKCETCGAAFKQIRSLRKHILNRHSEKSLSLWICQECHRSFKMKTSLENHMKKFHSDVILKSTLNGSTPEEQETTKIKIKKESFNNDISHEFEDQKFIISQEIPSGSMATSDEIHLQALDIIEIKSEMSLTDNSELDNEKIGDMEADLRVITSNRNKHSNPILYDDFISKWKGDLECPECKAIFVKYSLLNEHFHLNHPKERCYIICCNIFIINIDAIVEHIGTHIDSKFYQCNVCGRSYNEAQSLGRHKSRVQTDRRSTDRRCLCHCSKAMELCAKKNSINITASTSSLTTRKQKMLENDEIIAKWYPQLDCRICKEKFMYYSLLRAHFYCKHPQETCYIICCKRNFYKTNDALDHIRIHLDPYAFKCDLCNIPLSAKSSLKRHMREMHGEANIWNCDKCGKAYKRLKNLTDHITSEHANLKSYT